MRNNIKNIFKLLSVYVLALILSILVAGLPIEHWPRVLFGSLLITLAIFGGYENGRHL